MGRSPLTLAVNIARQRQQNEFDRTENERDTGELSSAYETLAEKLAANYLAGRTGARPTTASVIIVTNVANDPRVAVSAGHAGIWRDQR